MSDLISNVATASELVSDIPFYARFHYINVPKIASQGDQISVFG